MNEEAGIAYALIITLLGTIFVILRFSIRWNGWNNRANSARYVYILSDVFIVVSLVFTLAFCGFELWLRVGAIKRRGDPSLRVGRKAWDWQVKKLKVGYSKGPIADELMNRGSLTKIRARTLQTLLMQLRCGVSRPVFCVRTGWLLVVTRRT